MARNCELDIRRHVARRMRRRVETRKREAKAAGNPTPATSEPPHFTNIQNVRSLLSKRSESLAYLPIDDLPHRPRSHRRSLLCQQRVRSFRHQGIATVSTIIYVSIPFSSLPQQGSATPDGLWSLGHHHLYPNRTRVRRALAW